MAKGEMPGSHVVDCNVLEWRLAPSSDHRILDFEPGQQVIVFCDQAYQSSLAAVAVQDLSVEGATDLVAGYRVWRGSQ